MAAPGHVTTARGEVLDMEELKRKANARPLTAEQKAAMKDEVKPKKRPRKAINVRGNMPARGEEAPPMAEKRKKVAEAPAPEHKEFDKNPEGKSIADFTGIRIEEAKTLKGKVDDPVAHADGKLTDIMGELEANTPHSRDAADIVDQEDAEEAKKTTRTRKK